MAINKYIVLGIIGGLLFLKPNKGKTSSITPGSSQNTSNNNGGFFPIVSPLIVRNDPAGKGCYMCRRGSRKHNGLDVLINKYEDIVCPIDGVMSRYLQVYQSDKKYIGCEIVGTGEFIGYKIKLFYMMPANLVGLNITRGEYIGYAQAISEKYPGQGMLDHIHIEVYYNNNRIDPAPLFSRDLS